MKKLSRLILLFAALGFSGQSHVMAMMSPPGTNKPTKMPEKKEITQLAQNINEGNATLTKIEKSSYTNPQNISKDCLNVFYNEEDEENKNMLMTADNFVTPFIQLLCEDKTNKDQNKKNIAQVLKAGDSTLVIEDLEKIEQKGNFLPDILKLAKTTRTKEIEKISFKLNEETIKKINEELQPIKKTDSEGNLDGIPPFLIKIKEIKDALYNYFCTLLFEEKDKTINEQSQSSHTGK